MLVANGHKLYFYTHYSYEKHRNDIEIDFIISNNSKLKYKKYSIEEKSGEKYTTASLHRFNEKYKSRIGESYIIHPKNLVMKDGRAILQTLLLRGQGWKLKGIEMAKDTIVGSKTTGDVAFFTYLNYFEVACSRIDMIFFFFRILWSYLKGY